MLIALKVLLTTPTPRQVPPHLGRAVYAAALARLTEVAPAVAHAIHDGDGPKPLTCSRLLGAPPSGALLPDHVYAVRFSGLTADVAAALAAAFVDEPPPQIELDGAPMQVVEGVCEASRDGWTGRADYTAL